MRRVILALAVLIVLGALVLPSTSALAAFTSPVEKRCDTSAIELAFYPDTGWMDMPPALNSRVKEPGRHTCTVRFPIPTEIELINSQPEVRFDGVVQTSWDGRRTVTTVTIIYDYPSGNNAAGFAMWVRSAAPTPTAVPTVTPLPTATPSANRQLMPFAARDPAPAPTATPIPSNIRFVAPSGAWCGDPTRKMLYDERSGYLNIPEPLLSQIRSTTSRLNCEVYFNQTVQIFVNNETGEVWRDGGIFEGFSMRRELTVNRQLTVVYTSPHQSNGFDGQVRTTVPAQ